MQIIFLLIDVYIIFIHNPFVTYQCIIIKYKMNTVINKFYTGDLNKFGFGTWNSGEQNLKLKVQ